MPESARSSVLRRADVRALDERTIRDGVASLELMERAGRGLASYLEAYVSEIVGRDLAGRPRALVLAGSGNNGGDGFVLARLLEPRGWRMTVALSNGQPRAGSDAAVNLDKWRAMGGTVITREAALALLAEVARAGVAPELDLAIDAMFGTGLDRPLDVDSRAVVTALRDAGLPVVAVDLPSGLDADTGAPLGAAVIAKATATLGAAKPGLFLGKGPDYAGRVTVLDIGLVAPATANIEPVASVLDANTVAPLLQPRPKTTHKGDVGHVLVAGGSSGKSGAVLLAARAALRSGAGLVTMALPATLAAVADVALWEAMTIGLADDGHGSMSARAYAALEHDAARFSAAAVGPGLGTGAAALELVAAFIEEFPGTLVLDADALNVIAGNEAAAAAIGKRKVRRHGPVFLTPHPGEMARLLKTTSAAVQADRIGAMRGCLARYTDATVVLKGAATLVGNGSKLRFNTSGNPGMAAAGMGDVLAGTIAALASVIDDPFDAASAAVFAHGHAADLLARQTEGAGFFASEVADSLPAAFAEIRARVS